MRFDHVEGNLTLNALNEYDEYYLPRSMSRKTLYNLIKKFLDELGIKCDEDGYAIPNIFHDKFDKSISFELDLNEVQAGNYEGESAIVYPKDIQEAADHVYRKTYEALEGTPEITPENNELFERFFVPTKKTT